MEFHSSTTDGIAAPGSARVMPPGCTPGLGVFARPSQLTCLGRIAAIFFYLLPRSQVPEYLEVWRAITFDSPPSSPPLLADAHRRVPLTAPSGDHSCCSLDGFLAEGLDRLQLDEETTGASSACPTGQGIPAIAPWLQATSGHSHIYHNACHAVNVASSLYDNQKARSVDMSLSSAARKQAKQKLKMWLPQLDRLTELASDLVQESLPCPDVPSVSSSYDSDDGDGVH